jgi:hypothetical protein
MVFKTNDTEAMRIDASGNVGFGVTPASDWNTSYRALQLANTATFMGTISGDGSWISNNAIFSSSGDWEYIQTAATSSLDMQSGTAPFRFRYAASGTAGTAISWSEAMRIDSSGNVGIGRTSIAQPSSGATTLAIQGTSTTKGGAIRLYSSDDSVAAYIYPDSSSGLSINTSTSHPIVFRTAGTERMRIDASGLVGIGTSSPVQKLSVSGASGSARLSLERSNANTTGGVGNIQWNALDGHAVAGIIAYGDGNDEGAHIAFNTTSAASSSDVYVSTTERMRIDSSGNVGIGTASPRRKLEVSGGAGANVLQSQDTADSTNFLRMYADVASGSAINVNTGGVIRFCHSAEDFTSFTERMRIDASGNLLVGKTAVDSGVVGVEAKATGTLVATVAGDTVSLLNRKTNDGEILRFQKDGTTVGSIGSYNGVDLYIGDGEAGVKFSNDNNSIIPWNTNTNASRGDNTDLGGSSDRFRDLYLSGGAYLGGTAAANKLDDYEEGTWTPTIVGSTTAGAFTYNIQEGKYTKVGNSVSVNCAIYVTATATSPVGNVNIYGLPFTIGNQFPSFTIGWSQFITFADQLGAYGGGTQITLRNMLSAGSGANVSGADFGSAFYIFVSGTYQV